VTEEASVAVFLLAGILEEFNSTETGEFTEVTHTHNYVYYYYFYRAF
jgi:hypothetical protein